jgi:hypothetical protein
MGLNIFSTIQNYTPTQANYQALPAKKWEIQQNFLDFLPNRLINWKFIPK